MNGIALHGNNLLNGLLMAQSSASFLRGFFMDEIWKPIPGYEGFYEVSNLGRVRSFIYNKILAVPLERHGYSRISLYNNKVKKSHFVHRLVCAAFYGKSNLLVNHINHNRADNSLANLEYVSQRENSSYRKNRKGLLGASYRKSYKKWAAQISIDRKRTDIGLFDTELEAHVAYVNYIKSNGIENKYAIKEGINYDQ